MLNQTIVEKFTNWIQQKLNIHTSKKNRPPFFNEREVWWCQFGQNIGDEENGKGANFMRPVIILKKFNQNICLVVPTSTKVKDNKYYLQIEYNDIKISALIRHLRTIDTKRLKNKIARLSPQDFEKLSDHLQAVIFRQKN